MRYSHLTESGPHDMEDVGVGFVQSNKDGICMHKIA